MTAVRRVKVLALAAAAALAAHLPGRASAAPPEILHTPDYQSPVRGDPGDLLMIAGTGLQPADRVVYEALDLSLASAIPGPHPLRVPALDTALAGTAPIVKVDDPPDAITVRLPAVMERSRPYRLWVVDAAGEWSAPVSINDPRPLWITPAFVYSTADFAGLGRKIRVVGRNLEPAGREGSAGARSLRIRLAGPATYALAATVSAAHPGGSAAPAGSAGAEEQRYVSEARLPRRMIPGTYSVAVSRDGRGWTAVPDGRLEVRPDPAPRPVFTVSDPRFGSCRASDGADDTGCFLQALEAARRAGGGIVAVPAGRWEVSTARLPRGLRESGFPLARGVQLRGAGSASTLIVRRDPSAGRSGPLLTLSGENSILGIAFEDTEHFQSLDQSRAVIRLGAPPSAATARGAAGVEVSEIVISGDRFVHVGRAVVDSGRPIRHLFITRNEFGAYDNALLLTGSGATADEPFRIDDSIVRSNRFVPGSYLDVAKFQGTIATQLGASRRVDFSDNVADGASPEGLQDPGDARGWRAAFFWNLAGNGEEVLVSDNSISCPGDKAGDGEAVSFDGNRDTFGFDVAQPVTAAGPDWVTVPGPLLTRQLGQAVPASYYIGHWLSIVDGSGVGQSRRIEGYSVDPQTQAVTFRIAPGWDVIPARAGSRAIVLRQFWQVYVVANTVTEANPPCRKSNRNDPKGGVIGFWTPAADSVIAANRQYDTDGIEFLQSYSARTASCPKCVGGAALSMGLEIRDNLIDGEYDWTSDCSWSGIRGYFVATPTPDAPPPVLGFGTVIAHNTLSRADGQRGGAIEFARAGSPGPPPGRWPMVQSPLIYRNEIRDEDGPLPRPVCHEWQRSRAGIRLEGPGNVRDAVLEANRCERVSVPLEDEGTGTRRLCPSSEQASCECGSR